MAEELIEADLREFIVRHIDSVAQLEALLLLRNEQGAEWNATAIARRLYITEQHAIEVLRPLCETGLLRLDAGTYRYDGSDDQARNMVDHVANTYAKHLIPITQIIHGKPSRIREFANAFKFRKD